MKTRNELEVEKLKQKEWQIAMEQLKEAREHAETEHEKSVETIREMAARAKETSANSATEWFKAKLNDLHKPDKNPEELERLRREQARQRELEELRSQQEQITKRMEELNQGVPSHEPQGDPLLPIRRALNQESSESSNPDLLLQQLKAVLTNKKEEDPNKALLKALITAQNKVPGQGGTNTLNPGLVNTLGGGESGNTMADWLAGLNKQEEGESDVAQYGEGDPRQGRVRSGILDKAITNIQQKQVWPQQNLGEDWADEDVDFKQIKFEHLVAGESQTIETCTDPAQILGRLRLL